MLTCDQALERISAQLDNELTDREEALLEGLAQLDRQFCLRDLSPGGCADLLAVTLLAHFSIRHASSFFDISLSL